MIVKLKPDVWIMWLHDKNGEKYSYIESYHIKNTYFKVSEHGDFYLIRNVSVGTDPKPFRGRYVLKTDFDIIQEVKNPEQ